MSLDSKNLTKICHNGSGCLSLSQRQRHREKGAQKDRQRYTAIQTLVFYPSIIGKTSTVSSALKLDIDPSISSPASSLSSSLFLASYGTACIPFWWSLLFHLTLLSLCSSSSFSRLLFSFEILVILHPCLHPSTQDISRGIRMRCENKRVHARHMSGIWPFESQF